MPAIPAPLRGLLAHVAEALAGRLGSRLARRIGVSVAKDTMLCLLRAAPLNEPGSVRVFGVDEFALLRGHTYATLLVDLEARRPIEVLPGREAEPVARWLADYPEVEIVCRDRVTAYAEATRHAVPQAVQVADAWHLWSNLAKAVEKMVTAHYGCLRAAHVAANLPQEPEPSAEPDGTFDVRG